MSPGQSTLPPPLWPAKAPPCFNAILMVVCHPTKQALFISCHTTNNALEFTKLFLEHIFSKHGLPDNIIFHQGPLFVSHFWQLLCKALEIKTNLLTAYHPETNRQTEQNNWHTELPLAKFTYNNMPHSATGVSPFYANKGYNPQLTLSHKDIPSHIAHKVVEDLCSIYQFLWNKINTANQAYSKTLVLLNQCNLKTWRPSVKLNHKQLSPFKILQKVSTHAYKLDLPPGLTSLYPIFHIHLLEEHAPNPFPDSALVNCLPSRSRTSITMKLTKSSLFMVDPTT
ncbi:hypothetical protein E4T56_gene2656 [Termitomyces sp. T112]|nr:hypothetical protein E4T56_gene2656 [Termitomyces sp. T112]